MADPTHSHRPLPAPRPPMWKAKWESPYTHLCPQSTHLSLTLFSKDSTVYLLSFSYLCSASPSTLTFLWSSSLNPDQAIKEFNPGGAHTLPALTAQGLCTLAVTLWLLLHPSTPPPTHTLQSWGPCKLQRLAGSGTRAQERSSQLSHWPLWVRRNLSPESLEISWQEWAECRKDFGIWGTLMSSQEWSHTGFIEGGQ